MVGGADIYKAQDVGGGGGYDEFLQDFAKQVQPLRFLALIVYKFWQFPPLFLKVTAGAISIES